MRIIHTLGVCFYGLFIFLAQPFNTKAKKWIQGRKKYWENLPEVQTTDVVWFHCASLGEFDQGIPVMQLLKKENPAIFLMVTFFSPSGMEHYHKRNHPADWVGYLPLPTPKNAKQFIAYFKPKTVFFVKYEFWDNYLVEAKKQGSKNYCIAANFRENHRFFGSFKFLFTPTLFLFDKIFVQTDKSLLLLESIGYKNGFVSGDTRIDKVLENKEKCIKDEVVEDFLVDEKAIILGSSWLVDERFWLDYIQAHTNQKFIIAPHNISEKHIKEIQHYFPFAIRYSEWSNQETNILIVDCIGKLSNLYQYAWLAYVGGGFTGKLHNVLEAVVFNIPVIIGPKHNHFPEAQILIDKGIISSISEVKELDQTIEKVKSSLNDISEYTKLFFQENKDAAKKICSQI